MCIAAYVPANISIKEATLRECFKNNPDGAGVMYSDGDKVFITKGYMKEDEFVKAFMEIPETYDRGFHCRIATSGKIDEGCCHPFPLVDDMKEMKKTKHVVDGAVMHNGIISWAAPTKGKAEWYSDTMNFIATILHPLRSEIHNVALHDIIERSTTGNKFVIMTPHNVHLIGTFTQEGGVFYSNTTFRTSRVVYVDNGYGCGTYGNSNRGYGSYGGTRFTRKNNAVALATEKTVSNAFWLIFQTDEVGKLNAIASQLSLLGINVIEEDDALLNGKKICLFLVDKLPTTKNVLGIEWAILSGKGE